MVLRTEVRKVVEYSMIDAEKWQRYETFRRFYDEMSCSVSMCDDIDVTELKNACAECGRSFYISMLYVVSSVVNSHEEFRLIAIDSPDVPAPMPAVWDSVNPVHNIFHEESKTYTSVVTQWNPDYFGFYLFAEDDVARGKRLNIAAVPAGDNVFEASCVPWRHFTSVDAGCEDYPLSPIIVWGRFTERDGRTLMPLSIQINHAAADGFHLAGFLNEAEEKAAALAELLRKKGK